MWGVCGTGAGQLGEATHTVTPESALQCLSCFTPKSSSAASIQTPNLTQQTCKIFVHFTKVFRSLQSQGPECKIRSPARRFLNTKPNLKNQRAKDLRGFGQGCISRLRVYRGLEFEGVGSARWRLVTELAGMKRSELRPCPYLRPPPPHTQRSPSSSQ